MNTVSQFIANNMLLVFFVYGLSFFFLGTSVLFQARKGSGFKIGRCLWLLASFGLLHGLNEWLDMFLLLERSSWTEHGIKTIEIVRFFIGQISYIFLFQFGVTLLFNNSKQNWLPKASLLIYTIMAFVIFFIGHNYQFNKNWFLLSDLATRYFLAFPGACLTAIAFFVQQQTPEVKQLNIKSVSIGFIGLSVSFSIYAVLAGLIVKPAGFPPASIINYTTFMNITGLPVQFFRACCAISMIIFLSKVLTIFEIETKHKLDSAYQEIINISNREQMRIGQDLHDGLGQQLTGIAYMTKALETRLSVENRAEANDLKEIRSLLDSSIDATRALVRGLCPVSIEKEGLNFALQELANNTSRIFHINCIAHIDHSAVIQNNNHAVHLFRIAQEAITNAIKHGHADEIHIKLNSYTKTTVLSIEDNGIGIPIHLNQTSGVGLKIMKTRAKVLGAELFIDTVSPKGTVVKCIMPTLATGISSDISK